MSMFSHWKWQISMKIFMLHPAIMKILVTGWKFRHNCHSEMVTSKDGINIENLAEVAGEEYSDTSWMPTCDWMVDLLWSLIHLKGIVLINM